MGTYRQPIWQNLHTAWARWRSAPICTLLVLGGLSACADAPVTPPLTAPHEILYQLIVSPHGVTMAQHATQPLTLVAQNILGDTMSDFDPAAVQFVSEDSTRVTVSGGVLRAHAITPVDSFSGPVPLPQPTRVIASWTHAGVTKADTLYVAVTATVQPVNALSIQPAPYPRDSTWLAGQSSGQTLIPVTALTAQHDTIVGIYAFVSTGQRREHLKEYVDPLTASLSFAATPPEKHVWVYAEASVYGVVMRDSVEYVATYPTQVSVVLSSGARQRPQVDAGLFPAPAGFEFWLAPCTFVVFLNRTNDSLAIVFDDPTVTEGCSDVGETGNIVLLVPSSIGFRFIRPVGVHSWTVTRPNGTGFTPAVTGTFRVRSHTEF